MPVLNSSESYTKANKISQHCMQTRTCYMVKLAFLSYHVRVSAKVHNLAAKTKVRIGLIITNSQNMYICDISLFLQYLIPFEYICLSFLVF